MKSYIWDPGYLYYTVSTVYNYFLTDLTFLLAKECKDLQSTQSGCLSCSGGITHISLQFVLALAWIHGL